MPCYVVAEMEAISDPDGLKDYIAGAPGSVAAAGGRYVMRGVVPETLEGRDGGPRMSIIEFPDAEAARRWYTSPEYRALIPIRQCTTRSRFLILEGDPPAE